MDRARRLSRLEGELDPREAFLIWLGEAQRYPSVIDYARAHVDDDPLGAVFDHAIERAHQKLRKRPGDEIVKATRRLKRELLVAYHLVIRSNLDAERRLEVDRLRIELLTMRMRELSLRERLPEQEDDRLANDWTSWGATATDLRVDMDVTDAARLAIESRYLAGHESLFPMPAEAVADQCRQVDALVETARSEGHVVTDPVVSSELVEAMTDGYVRLASADARLAMDEDDAADAVIRPLLAVTR